MTNELKKKRIKQLCLAAVTITPLIYLPILQLDDFFYTGKVYFIMALALIYVVFLFNYRTKIHLLIDNDKINLLLLIYFILICISVFFAKDKLIAIDGVFLREEGLKTVTVYFLLFLAARSSLAFDKKSLKFILFTAFIVSAYGILQFMGIELINQNSAGFIPGLVTSTLGNPNYVGTYLVLMLPISIHLFIFTKNKPILSIFAILLICLLCTMTRAAWIGALVGTCLYFILIIHKRKTFPVDLLRTKIIIVTGLIIIIVFNGLTNGSVFGRFLSIISSFFDLNKGGSAAASAGSYRGFIWERVLTMISNKPWFGYGPENMGQVFTEIYAKDSIRLFGNFITFDRPHNEYLYIAVSSGIPSLLAYIAFLSLTLRNGFKKMNTDPFMIPLIAAVTGYLVQAFFSNSIVSVVYIFWIFLGLLAANQCTGN